MIYPATLILATLVFNAASGLGAPVRITRRADSGLAARETVDVPGVRSVASDPIDVRSEATSENDIRDTSSQPIEARDSLPEVDRLVRRFPRRHYADFYQRRSTQPEARAEPAAESVEARSEAPVVQRRYPRRGLAEKYETRATTPSPEELAVAREPSSEQAEAVYRRFPRKVYAEYAENMKRQEEAATTPAETPAGEPTPVATESPAATAEASSSAPAATGEATATATAAGSTATATISPSAISPGNPGTPSNLEGLLRNITANADDGFQEGTTIKETTLLVNKITHISGTKDTPAQNIVESKVLATTVTATPTATASSEATPSAAVTGTPAEGAPQGGESPAATESPSATSTSAPEAQPTSTEAAAAGGEATATGTGEAGAARRALGNGNIRRNVGFSGAAYASYAKRNVN